MPEIGALSAKGYKCGMKKRLSILLAICGLGLAVSACDKCGNWWKPGFSGPNICQPDQPVR